MEDRPQYDVRDIKISGRTFVTIAPHASGLRLVTHRLTIVEQIGTSLIIRDPQQVVATNADLQPMMQWTLGSSINSFVTSIIGNINNVNSNNGSSIVISNGGITVLSNMSNVTKDECDTEHIIACRYDNLNSITSQGSIKTWVEVLLSNTRDCSISANGSGAIVITENQKFTKLELNLGGSGHITLVAATINRLRVNLQGSGSVTVGNDTDIHTADISLTGSGEIILNDSEVDSMVCVLTGSGDINDFTVLSEARFTVTGSGTIRCEAKRNARIRESRIGSGKIRVTRCK